MESVLTARMIPGTEVRLASFGSFRFSNGVGITNLAAAQYALEELAHQEILPHEEAAFRACITSATIHTEEHTVLLVTLDESRLLGLGIVPPDTG